MNALTSTPQVVGQHAPDTGAAPARSGIVVGFDLGSTDLVWGVEPHLRGVCKRLLDV